MPTRGKQVLDRKLVALEALRSAADPAAIHAPLVHALEDRNSYLVARAATIASDLRVPDLESTLVEAFERLMVDPAKADPQCLGKTAIANALRELGYREPELYLRGLAHVQLEPAWGGRADTAAGLRGACALALVDARLPDLEILSRLTDTLADPDKLVRIDGARAIEQLNREEGALLLRLKALVGDVDPDVQGQCFTSYLSLAADGAVSFVARFLNSSSEDVQLESASALAQCRDPEAIRILREYWRDRLRSDDLRRALLIALGASPLMDAADFLIDVVHREPIEYGMTAIPALANGRYRNDVRPRVAAIVEGRDSPRLTAVFDAEFGRL
jgi:hypothetical protein